MKKWLAPISVLNHFFIFLLVKSANRLIDKSNILLSLSQKKIPQNTH
ncbi:hypothetical protein C8P65_10772 [Capnocytophaga leadbetteri]|uniref:Uncharacterized protein n=1 Tax=Capnocytophaga leadbetteri TaxID=327575 RepID=A0A2T5XU10_9FLAO|nr:hypothetical protein C8P65_10772 [Capnocytophaga leadbetteri]